MTVSHRLHHSKLCPSTPHHERIEMCILLLLLLLLLCDVQSHVNQLNY